MSLEEDIQIIGASDSNDEERMAEWWWKDTQEKMKLKTELNNAQPKVLPSTSRTIKQTFGDMPTGGSTDPDFGAREGHTYSKGQTSFQKKKSEKHKKVNSHRGGKN